jgi:hypothetical protein
MCNELPLGSRHLNLKHVANPTQRQKHLYVQYVWACDVLVHLTYLCATKPFEV